MLKPDEANNQLNQWRRNEESKGNSPLDWLVESLKKMPKKLSEPTLGILGFNSKGESLSYRWNRTAEDEKIEANARIAFEALSAADRQKIFAVLAPKMPEQLEAAWQFQKSTPYQVGYGRRPFRAPDHPELSLQARTSWFAELASALGEFQGSILTPAWLAQWTPHAFSYRAHRVAPILAAVIDSGTSLGKEIFAILCRTVTREDPIGLMGDHVINSLLMASNPEGWELLEKTLLAAQRQEGLRQSILNHADLAHPEAFARMLRLILDHDLVRFSSVARCIDVWFNLLWDSASTKVLNDYLEQVLKLMDSTTERNKALAGSDAESIYRALWASAFFDAPKTVPIASALLKNRSDDVRFVAAWGLTTIGLQSAANAKLALSDDTNLQIALTAVISSRGIKTTNDTAGVLDHNDPSGHDLFERLERLYLRLPEKPITLKPIVWPWTERVIERSILVGTLLGALDDLPPTRILPYLASMETWQRRQVVGFLAKQKKWDTLTRSALLDLVGDASSDVRKEALEALEKQPLASGESDRLENYLSRKSDDLRRGVVKLLLRENDQAALASVDRLTASKDANQRLAGLEILRQMAERNRSRPQCQLRAEAYRTGRKKLSREEETQINGITGSRTAVATLDDALGLMNPDERTPVVLPQKKKLLLISPAAIACMKSLDEFIHEHRETPIMVEDYNGPKEELFGVARYLPSLDLDKPLEPQRAKLPLIELFEKWNAKRTGKLRDKDGLELLRAGFASDLFSHSYLEAAASEKKEPITKEVLAKVLGIIEPPALRYSSHVKQILQWLVDLDPPTQSIDYLLDCIENSYAWVPEAKQKVLADPSALDEDEFEENLDWRHDSIFNAWSTDLSRAQERIAGRLTAAQTRRYWELEHFFDQPIPGASRRRPSMELLCKAIQGGYANQNDLADQLLGHSLQSRQGRSFADLAACNLGFEQLQEMIQATPGLSDLLERIPERILEIELARGESPTAATYPALALRNLMGTSVLFRIMDAVAKAKLKKETSWRENAQTSRAATFTHLLQVTYPKPTDTQQDFNQRMKEAIANGIWSEQRVLDLAFLAPQWTKFVEGFLSWKGFAEGLYWFVAHMDTGWGSYAGQIAAEAAGHQDDPEDEKPTPLDRDSEQEDLGVDEDASPEAKPKKLTAWERLLLERTPLTEEERTEGAVDISWFRRTWADLGEIRWKQMAEAAKFAANSQQANKAQFLADVLLGNITRKELMEGIQKRKLKEHVRLLGLLPLAEGAKREADLRERYETMQDYRKYARGLSSLSKPAAMRASEIGSQNLARLAGYPDPLRLEWAMEAESVQDLAKGPVSIERDGVKVTLSLDAEAKPQLDIERAGKPLKAIPPQVKKKHAEIAELTERGTELRRKSSRMKWSLETALCRGDSFTGTELQQLMDHAILAPLLSRLVLIGEGIAGYPDKKGKALRDHQGKLEPVKPAEKLRIAHPHDLFALGDWAKWQQECFQSERVQPFKQVFRELYPLTAQEKADGAASNRFAGQQIQPKQAMALWGQRGWSTQDGICKIFHELSLVVDVSFLDGAGTAVEVEGWTLDAIRFRKRDEFKPLLLAKIPPVLFSEVMRDLDLVVSVAHRGEVDPEASASTVEMRSSLIRETCQLLGLKNVRLKGTHALIDGHFSQYSLHLGSGGVHRMPGGALCILPVHAQHRGRLFLPFADDDPRTAEIVSKILLLARDSEVQDPTILAQLGAPLSQVAIAPLAAAKASAKAVKKPAKSDAEESEATGAAGDTKRRFEFAEGASNKFWEIEIDGEKVTTRWGRLGTDGQTKTKTFGDATGAQKEFDKLIKEKSGKGYREI